MAAKISRLDPRKDAAAGWVEPPGQPVATQPRVARRDIRSEFCDARLIVRPKYRTTRTGEPGQLPAGGLEISSPGIMRSRPHGRRYRFIRHLPGTGTASPCASVGLWMWFPPPAERLRDMRGDEDIAHSAASAGGGTRELDLLYRSQAGRIRRRVRAEVGSSDEASDLVQEAFSRLAGSTSDGLRNPAAFLSRIVSNLLIDRRRRLSARPPHVALEPDCDVPVRADQADALEYEQMKARYRAVVERLPPRTREVFLLHRVDDLSYREIASRLDISIRTVEWHIAEAIVRIAKGLDA